MSAEAIEVTLRSSDSLDGFEERRFTLHPNASVPIGRASRNTQKPELVMSASNAFIDSPVISREHAILSTDGTPPTPSVYITDSGSMHGTTVNGDKIDPHQAIKLSDGDQLQFGIDVTRNDNFYVARQFIFHSSAPDSSFARGFSVPDVESSEDEEADSAIMSPSITNYGTQMNPVTIDEPECVSTAVIEIEQDEEIDIHAQAVAGEETGERHPSPPRDADLVLDEHSDGLEDIVAATFGSNNGAFSDEDDDNSIYSSEEDEFHHESVIVPDSSEADSDEDVASSSGESDDEVEKDVAAVRRMKMGVMLNDEQEEPTLRTDTNYFAPHSPQSASQSLPSPPVVPASHRHEPPAPFEPTQTSSKSAPKIPEHEGPATGCYLAPSIFDDQFGNVFGHVGNPLAPRSAAPKPVNWSVTPDYNSHLTQREAKGFGLFSEDLPHPNMFMLPNPNYTPDMFNNFTERVGNEAVPPKPFPYQHQHQPLPENSWSLKTPPPNDSAVSASCDVPSELQPTRRTKVSIPEIVEDAPQAPLTPISVTRNLKRKADTLEEDVMETVAESTPQPLTDAAETSVSAGTAGSTMAIEHRPKKRSRGRLGAAVRNMAAYLIPGTAVAVGLLTQLPEDFFKA